MNARVCLLGIALVLLPGQALAVTALEQSRRLLILEALLLDLKYNGRPSGDLALGVDFINQPEIDYTVGTKREHVNKPPVVPRPRLRFIYNGLLGGVAWVPPVEINGLAADVWSAEFGYRMRYPRAGWLGAYLRDVALQFRSTLTHGAVRGRIASDHDEDRIGLHINTFDALAEYQGFDDWRFYAGYGLGRLSSAIDIGEDGARIEVLDHDFEFLFLGATVVQGDYALTVQQDWHALLRNVTVTVFRRF